MFCKSLPHPSTIRKWYESVDGDPGFTSSALTALNMKALDASSKNEKVICALIVDEMSIRKHIEWDGKAFCGYIDYGTDLDDDQLPVATEAYTFLCNAVNASWKIPIGYFLINGLAAIERSNIIKKALEILHEIGIDVVSLTFDGTVTNLATAECLGASFKIKKLKPTFEHPTTGKEICAILDPSHMVKLVRNTIASTGSLYDNQGRMVKWQYVVSLHKVQTDEGLLAATKLGVRHIQWKREKMKVRLATQVLSASVSNALLYLAEDLKHPEFQGCEATVEFLQLFNDLFDVLNSKNLHSKNYKKPLNSNNMTNILEFFDKAENYIKNLRTSKNGQLVLESKKKTGFLGFLTGIYWVKFLYSTLIETNTLKFILTYKFSQDHLEMFFSAIRSKGGFNNNPTAKQFKSAYVRLLLKNEISSSTNANCLPLDDTNILNVIFSKNIYLINLNQKVTFDISLLKINDDDFEDEYSQFTSSKPLRNANSLSFFAADIVDYITGFVIRKLYKTTKCGICKSALTFNPHNSALIKRKNKGGLVVPGVDSSKICKTAEKEFRICEQLGQLQKKNLMQYLIIKSMRKLPLNVYSTLDEHILDDNPFDNHKILLIKTLLFEYLKIRLIHVAKQYTRQLQTNKIRSLNNKTTIFKGQ